MTDPMPDHPTGDSPTRDNPTPDNPTIYKICTAQEWAAAAGAGVFAGSAADRADGFLHFSTAAQLRETAARHFAGRGGLVLLTVDAGRLGPALRWEPSRGGALFPHLYGPLPRTAVRAVDALPLGPEGRHRFPPGLPPAP